MADKIRVGIIGARADRGWAAMSHIPAIKALPDYELTAVATTSIASAREAAAAHGARHAFDNPADLARCPEVDLVVVAVKVTHHHTLALAAIEAGKNVYCEWPLGVTTAEAEDLSARAKAAGVRTVVGLQMQFAPPIAFARDLVAQGYVGEVLSTTMVGSGFGWGPFTPALDAYSCEKASGATMLSISAAHMLDGMCSVLGEVTEVTATLANRRTTATVMETGAQIPMTAEDQIAFAGRLAGGAFMSVHYRGGYNKATNMLWEINGTQGDLRITYEGMAELALSGANGDMPQVQRLQVPDSYFHSTIREGVALNVAENYVRLARDLREGTSIAPDFDYAVARHKVLDAIARASETGVRQHI